MVVLRRASHAGPLLGRTLHNDAGRLRDGPEASGTCCLCNQSGPGIIEEGMSTPSNWPRNRLLLALPAGNLKRLMRAPVGRR